jgi:hypothetical protein
MAPETRHTTHQETTRSHEPPAHYQHKAHPYVKWIIALIVGFLFSLAFMVLIVAQVVKQAGIGTDLVFDSFFVYTGGFILLQNAGNSILMFVLATIYYFLFFSLIGLIVGFIVEWLINIIRHD